MKYTMDDFINKQIGVKCKTNKEVRTFLDWCNERGMEWRGGDPVKLCHYHNERAVVISGFCGDDNHTLSVEWPTYDPPAGWKEVDFSDIIPDAPDKSAFNCRCTVKVPDDVVYSSVTQAPKYRICIECDGTNTEAVMYVDGKAVKKAKAKRNPDDKFSLKTGAQLALGRLFEKQEKPEKKVPGQFEIGDRVVWDWDGFEKHGKIVCHNPRDHSMHGVELDEYVGMHNLGGKCKDGHGVWLYPSRLRRE